MGIDVFAIFDPRGDLIVKRRFREVRNEDLLGGPIKSAVPCDHNQSLWWRIDERSEALLYSSCQRLVFAVLYDSIEKLKMLTILKQVSSAIEYQFCQELQTRATASAVVLRKNLLTLTAMIEHLFDPGGGATSFDGQAIASIIPCECKSSIKSTVLSLGQKNKVANAVIATIA